MKKMLSIFFLIVMQAKAAEIDFTRDVRPILSEYCFSCHGPDDQEREGRLRLDVSDGKYGAYRVRKSRAAVKPGNPLESHVYLRMITDDEDDLMPPPESKKEMKPEEISIIKKWIEQGAEYKDHWSFKAPQKNSLPKVEDQKFVRNEIDSFVLNKLIENGMKPSLEASKSTLLRRLYLDLTGLPPTVEQMDRFLADKSDNAYEKVVDSLLQSPHHAEKLTVEWLDAARYSDTNGYSIDDHRDMWAWRDWVINAYKENMPYDRFIAEQIAGDLIAKPLPKEAPLNNPAWIWVSKKAKTGEAEFMKEFKLNEKPSKALLNATCDNSCTVYINDQKVASSNHWREEAISLDVAQYLVKGKNKILVKATNEGDVAGLVFYLETDKTIIKSDKTWKARTLGQKKWSGAHEVAVYGANPWGQILKIKVEEPRKLTAGQIAEQQKIVATGFLRNSMNTHEGGTIAEEYRVQYNVDKVDTVSTAVLGLTVKCAQCHDHKYDPVSQEDFYKFYAFFNSSSEPGKGAVNGNTKPFISVNSVLCPEDEMIRQYEERIAELEKLKKSIDPKTKINGFKAEATIKSIDEEIRVIRRQIETGKTTVMIMDHRKDAKTHILGRGQYNKPAKEVTAGALNKILPFSDDLPKNRLGLAKWIFDKDNPLTARVAVNRYWKIIFGTGIVKTAEDFGSQGELPSHPELLDFLAVSFREDDWDVRSLIKKMVMSSTYRQSSKSNPEYAAKDPWNRLMWRAPVYRLQAEFVRDNALSIAGILSTRIGGPSVFPKQPGGLWAQVSHFGYGRPFTAQTYFESMGKNHYRRSLYTVAKRTAINPSMAAFDAPSREVCTARRMETNTPLQSLTAMNDPQFVNAARHLALRMKNFSTLDQKVQFGFRAATGRKPLPSELKVLKEAYQEQAKYYSLNLPDAAKLLKAEGTAQDAALVMIASTILNLSETLTRN